MSDDATTPLCPHCGKPNCVPCRATVLLERITALRTGLPQRSADERRADLERAPALELYVSMCGLVIDLTVRELRQLCRGRTELCAAHSLSAAAAADDAAEIIRSAGFEPDGLAASLLRARSGATVVAAVTAVHTLKRVSRLWHEVREHVRVAPDAARVPEHVGSAFEEIDELLGAGS